MMRLALVFALPFLSLLGCHVAASLTFNPRLPPAEAGLEHQVDWKTSLEQSDIDFSLWYEDPAWFDSLGRDTVDQLRIFDLKDEDAQVQHVLRLLDDFPRRGPDLLQKAVLYSKPKVIRALLERRADPALKTKGYIHTAAQVGCLDCVKILVTEAGVDPDLVDHDLGDPSGWTPLLAAVLYGRRDVVEWLLNTGRVNTAREMFRRKYNLLKFAVVKQPHIVQLLLDHPKAKENRRKLGVTEEEYLGSGILTLAASGGDARLFHWLLSRIKYPTASNDSPRAWMGDFLTDAEREKLEEALHEATERAHIDIVRLLLETYLLPPGDPDVSSLFGTRMAWSLKEGTESAKGQKDRAALDFLLGLKRYLGNGAQDVPTTIYENDRSDGLMYVAQLSFIFLLGCFLVSAYLVTPPMRQ